MPPQVEVPKRVRRGKRSAEDDAEVAEVAARFSKQQKAEENLGKIPPPGWSPDDPDLYTLDLDEQIKRCQKRIEEGYMTSMFERRLKMLSAQKEKQEAVKRKWPELTLATAERLEMLESLVDHLHKIEDPSSCLSCVEAIMEAYKTKKLEVQPGLVTYWSYGVQLGEPRPFKIEEFSKLNQEHKGDNGFFVEGYRGYNRTSRSMAHRMLYPSKYHGLENDFTNMWPTNFLPISLRIPREPLPDFERSDKSRRMNWSTIPRGGVPEKMGDERNIPTRAGNFRNVRQRGSHAQPFSHLTFWCFDDTGADHMQLSRNDIELLRNTAQADGYTPGGPGTPAPNAPLVGYGAMVLSNGLAHWSEFRFVEANMYDGNGRVMSPVWDLIDCSISETSPGAAMSPPRLAGPWLRHRFYTATVPDGRDRLYVGTNNTSWAHMGHPFIGSSGMLYGDDGIQAHLPAGAVVGGAAKGVAFGAPPGGAPPGGAAP